MEKSPTPTSNLETPSSSFDPKEVFREAQKNPAEFWQSNYSSIEQGFSRPAYVGRTDQAQVAIMVPSHNENSGEKAGHLMACLYALSQLRLSSADTLKVIVIGHNESAEDGTEALLKQLGEKVEYLAYDTPLRSFSYPLQVAPCVLRSDEVTEVGIIDADTVVNPDWLQANRTILAANDGVQAIACPRTYLDRNGEAVPYGTVKLALEQGTSLLQRLLPSSLSPAFATKLVSGNSYYRYDILSSVMSELLGKAVTDGHIQHSIASQGGKIHLNPEAWAVSDGEKFIEARGVALLRTLVMKVRRMLAPGLSDHIAFLEQELPSYFPDFATLVDKNADRLSRLKSEQRLQLLQQLLSEYEASTQVQIQHDIAQLKIQRANS
ncbi:MAG: glycosyltransferase family A protein [Patescibacteria group bacterium]